MEVKPPNEILHTLDSEGTLEGLPFMPEMIGFSGQRFQVEIRVFKTCVSISRSTNMRVFKMDDIVTLRGPRCSGLDHDGCQKACTIFWHASWLRKVQDSASPSQIIEPDADRLRSRLKTMAGPQTYFCQASELLKLTNPLSRWGRFGMCFADVRAGNASVLEMAQRIAIWVFWRLRRLFLGVYGRGPNKTTPVETLNLQPGEVVEVKSVDSISRTLDETAHNRGLYFTPDMRQFCGHQQRVEKRLDRLIVDGTGEMRQLRNTVYLEGSQCGCSHVAFGGCPRREYTYWREIWLRRPTPVDSVPTSGKVHAEP